MNDLDEDGGDIYLTIVITKLVSYIMCLFKGTHGRCEKDREYNVSP